jgi:hypothetical protein
MARQGYGPPTHAARDLLHDRDGAFAYKRDRRRVGAHAVARDAARGVGGDDEVGGNMMTGSCGAVLVRVVTFG